MLIKPGSVFDPGRFKMRALLKHYKEFFIYSVISGKSFDLKGDT